MDRALRDMSAAIAVLAPNTASASAGSAMSNEAFVVTAASTSLSAEKVLTTTTPIVGTVGASTVIISAPTVVVGPAVATANAIVRFNSTTGKLVQDYTSGAPTISDTGVVSVSAGMTITGAVTNSSTYSVGTNQLGFLSTVPATAGVDYGFDFKDTIARSTSDFLLGMRDSAGNYRIRGTGGANIRLIIGDGTSRSSTIGGQSGGIWTMFDNAAGNSADPGLKVLGTATSSTFLAGTTVGLAFKAGSGAAAPDNRLLFQPDGSGATLNDNYTLFQNFNAGGGWLGVTANDWMQWDFTGVGIFGYYTAPPDGRRVFKALIDGANDVYISQGGRWGNQAARVGFGYDTAQFQTWDLLLGGGFKFTGVGAVEPVT